jgi:hypothetical protein
MTDNRIGITIEERNNAMTIG